MHSAVSERPFLLLLLVLALVPPARAQEAAPAPEVSIPSDIRIEGPAPPAPPEVINRNDAGDATVRAVPLTDGLRLDGRLDEQVYRDTPPISGFIQSLPDEGAPATERTDAWITYDDESVYISARVWESAPPSQWIANEMRRDSRRIGDNDTFGVVLDTFYDQRNAVFFYTNPLGALADAALTNEGSANFDWNPVWDVRTGRFDDGWTVEMEIPFKSLRHRSGRAQVWGVQLRRAIRRKNEWAHLTLVPRSAAGTGRSGVFRISAAATLVGLEAPEASRTFEIKPYAISGLETDRLAVPPTSNEEYADGGLDVKYGLTQNLTLDLTYNTDFAQVEVDEQQVNLTRFNLFFPEKREFFLEGQGIFDFGSGAAGSQRRGDNTPTLFFSRRIGLQSGEPVPILAGGRLTGKAGDFDVGVLGIRTEADPGIGVDATNFSVVRLRRDVLRRSSVGVLFARRSESIAAEGSNETYGADVSLTSGDLNFLGYYAETRTPGRTAHEESFQTRLSYDGDAWGLQLEHLLVAEGFNPEVGFLRRRGFRESFASGRFSPRPESVGFVRQLTFEVSLDYLVDSDDGFVETRDRIGRFQVELENSDVFDLTYTESYEGLSAPFRVAAEATVPPGRYAFRDVRVGYRFGEQRPWSGSLAVQRGTFFGGERTTAEFSRGRLNLTERLSVEPSVSFNWIDLPTTSFRTDLAVTRVNLAFTPRMFLSGLVQYNSAGDSFSTNVRLRWEYVPGSELFVVFTEARETAVFDPFARLANRGLAIKLNYLLRL